VPGFRPFLSAPILAATLLGTLSCVDHDEVDGLYVFDGASRTIMIWAKPEQLLAAARKGKPAPEPDRTLRSGALAGINLAMGGMTLDPSRKRLYLVTERGTVYVVPNPGEKRDDPMDKDKGKGKGKDADEILSFKLKSAGDHERTGAPTFGQASVDPGTDVLYVMENGRDTARIWHVANVSRIANGATVDSRGNTSRADEDRRGIGVAAGPGHQFYALFGAGDRTDDGFGNGTEGPRLRLGEHKGDHPAFQPRNGHRDHHLVAGDATLLDRSWRYGSLAYSRPHHCVYVLAGPRAGKAQPGILVFNDSQFQGSLDQAPARILEKVPDGLTILAHHAHTDWLAGAGTDRAGDPDEHRDPDRDRDRRDRDPDRDRERRRATSRTRKAKQPTGGAALYLWKSPSEGGEPVKLSPLAPGIAIRGLAFGND
jgi:hypothetical protein